MPERKSAGIRIAELSQTIDILGFMVGGVVFLFAPGAGLAIITVNGITYLLAEQYKQSQRKAA